MSNSTVLVSTAKKLALLPFDDSKGRTTKLFQSMYAPFKKVGDGTGFDWCAVFVYYVCRKAGINLPAKPKGQIRCSLGGVYGWLDWAKLPKNRCYFSAKHPTFKPKRGDLVIFDNLPGQGLCDHIGVVLSVSGEYLCTAEGNVYGMSGVFKRKRNKKVRGYIRIKG